MNAPSVTTSTRRTRRRAIVTGGARGIGGQIARRLAEDGADVVVLDRLAELGEATAALIGGRFVEVDLTDADATRDRMTDAVGLLGGIDVLVNSAGILRLTPLIDIGASEWDEVMAINARATLVTMQVAASTMIRAGAGGSILNLSSMAAKSGGAGEAHYAASKSAVLALTRAGAQEWGPHGIRVNALCPGYVLTEMGAATRTEDDVAAWCGLSPLGRLGTPSDIAGVAAFLASADAAYMTGQAINVTGGMVMH